MYGFYPRPISYNKPYAPIDALINYTDAHYIDWDFAQPKFLQAIFRHYPNLDLSDDLPALLIKDLESAIERQSQQEALIDKLIKMLLKSRHSL